IWPQSNEAGIGILADNLGGQSSRPRVGFGGGEDADSSGAYLFVAEAAEIPWTVTVVERHTRIAAAGQLNAHWAKVPYDSLERNGDEGRAIREANAVIARQAQSG